MLIFFMAALVQASDCNSYTAVEVALLLDTSGSANWKGHFDNQLRVANAILSNLRQKTDYLYVGTIAFNDKPRVISEMTLDSGKALQRADFGDLVNGTHFENALLRGKQMLIDHEVDMSAKVTATLQYIILLADGIPNYTYSPEDAAEFRKNSLEGVDIEIACALLTLPNYSQIPIGKQEMIGKDQADYEKVKQDGLNILRGYSCADPTSSECKHRVMKKDVGAKDVGDVEKQVSKLFGDLVHAQLCGEPSIGIVALTVAPEETNADGVPSENTEEDKKQGLDTWHWVLIALAVLAVVLLLALAVFFVTKKKADKPPTTPRALDSTVVVKNERMDMSANARQAFGNNPGRSNYNHRRHRERSNHRHEAVTEALANDRKLPNAVV